MIPIRTTSRTLVMLSVCLLAVGLWQIGEGSWIYAKARLAQYLLQRAWSHTLAGRTGVRPWPWADTYPVARLMAPSMHVDLIVLNGSYGRTMAFGPGYAEASAFPGSPGTTILTGHRDTHFRFLKRLKRQDEIIIETVRRTSERYRVHSTRIVDARTASMSLTGGMDELALVTCYPFDTVLTGGPLRYVVRAIRVPSALPRSTDRPSGTESAGRGESMPPR
jgi:sortase A